MNTNTTIEKMRRMRMKAMAEIYHQSLQKNLYTDYSIDDYLTLLIDTEWESRQNRQIATLIASAGFKQIAASSDIDYTTPRNVSVRPSPSLPFNMRDLLLRSKIDNYDKGKSGRSYGTNQQQA